MELEHTTPPGRWPNVNAPPGYRFKPTPRELIQGYLEPWVTGGGHKPSPGEFYGIMAAADVYGEEPGALASRFQRIAHDDGNWYFLSVARWKDAGNNAASSSSSSSSRRMNRTVAGDLGGTWHGSGKRIRVRGVGYRQSFEFRPAGGGKTVWLMEEFGTARDGAAGADGVRVLCRLHLRPKAAAAAAAAATAGDELLQHQHQLLQFEANDVPPAAPSSNKRQRQLAAAAAEPHFDADYWTPYATASAPAQPDVDCSSSYCTTASHAAAAAAAPEIDELTAEELAATWQHQPMMEQAGDGGYQQSYDYAAAGVVHGDGEPQPLEMVAADVDHQFTAQDSKLGEDRDYSMFTVEQLMQVCIDAGCILESNSDAFSFLQPTCCDGVQENNDPKPEPGGGVQENVDTDDDPTKGGTGGAT